MLAVNSIGTILAEFDAERGEVAFDRDSVGKRIRRRRIVASRKNHVRTVSPHRHLTRGEHRALFREGILPQNLEGRVLTRRQAAEVSAIKSGIRRVKVKRTQHPELEAPPQETLERVGVIGPFDWSPDDSASEWRGDEDEFFAIAEGESDVSDVGTAALYATADDESCLVGYRVVSATRWSGQRLVDGDDVLEFVSGPSSNIKVLGH